MSIIQTFITTSKYAKLRLVHKFRDLEDTTNEESVQGKVVMITGGNAGIGKVVATQMARRKAEVILACRDVGKAGEVIEEIRKETPDATVHCIKLDLGSQESVRSCAEEVKRRFPQIHILINNAAYLAATSKVERTSEGFEKHFVVNHLGHFLLTHLLLDHLKKGTPARIVCVGSLASQNAQLNLEDIHLEKDSAKGFMIDRAYNNSKLCLMLFAKELSRRLEGTGINTYTLCPGIVRTKILNGYPWHVRAFMQFGFLPLVGCSPEQGAETVLYCALAKELSRETGKSYRFRHSWNAILKEEEAKDVWKISEELLGIQFGQ